MDVSGNYNPFTYNDGKKLKHWLIQPELRYWTCERFNGHFIGFHGHYAEYNVCKFFGLDCRYEGKLYGGGISYGYQWIIGKRWNLEATIGIGYAHLKHDKYECQDCGDFLGRIQKNYFGPTKAGITFVYLIK